MYFTIQILYYLEAAFPLHHSKELTVMEAPQLLILIKDVHSINTRFRSNLHNYYVLQINTTLARNSTQYQCISIFNKLSNRLKERNHWQYSSEATTHYWSIF